MHRSTGQCVLEGLGLRTAAFCSLPLLLVAVYGVTTLQTGRERDDTEGSVWLAAVC